MIGDDPRWPVTYYVYAYVDPHGDVLYVGQTCTPDTRRTAHRVRSPWWSPELTWALVCIETSRAASRAAEVAAIRALAPTFNIHHNTQRKAAA